MYCLLAYREVIRALEVLRQCLIQSILTNGRESGDGKTFQEILQEELDKEKRCSNTDV